MLWTASCVRFSIQVRNGINGDCFVARTFCVEQQSGCSRSHRHGERGGAANANNLAAKEDAGEEQDKATTDQQLTTNNQQPTTNNQQLTN